MEEAREKGQEGHQTTALIHQQLGSWEAAPGSWPGAMAAQPSTNRAGRDQAGLMSTAPVSHPLWQRG